MNAKFEQLIKDNTKIISEDGEEDIQYIDFNTMSELGLLYIINRDFLHPLGLALSREEDGTSRGAIIADDGFWEYSEDVIERNENKIKNFDLS